MTTEPWIPFARAREIARKYNSVLKDCRLTHERWDYECFFCKTGGPAKGMAIAILYRFPWNIRFCRDVDACNFKKAVRSETT